MAAAAEADNVRCKISGLGMGDNNWTVESIRPYVSTASRPSESTGASSPPTGP